MGPPRTTIDMAGHARTAISATAHRRSEYLRLMPLGKQFACLNSILQNRALLFGQIIENDRDASALDGSWPPDAVRHLPMNWHFAVHPALLRTAIAFKITALVQRLEWSRSC